MGPAPCGTLGDAARSARARHGAGAGGPAASARRAARRRGWACAATGEVRDDRRRLPGRSSRAGRRRRRRAAERRSASDAPQNLQNCASGSTMPRQRAQIRGTSGAGRPPEVDDPHRRDRRRGASTGADRGGGGGFDCGVSGATVQNGRCAAGGAAAAGSRVLRTRCSSEGRAVERGADLAVALAAGCCGGLRRDRAPEPIRRRAVSPELSVATRGGELRGRISALAQVWPSASRVSPQTNRRRRRRDAGPRRWPHSWQKVRCGGFSRPHVVQVMTLPRWDITGRRPSSFGIAS